MLNKGLWYNHFGLPEDTLNFEALSIAAAPTGQLLVNMLLSPVNASDLIPITGAYQHRITPPLVAGYEGIGVVVESTPETTHLIGKRVLPLRGEGTWQQYVYCPAEYAIAVPEDIDSPLAARAYINPLAALLMLKLYNPSHKRILLTGASSDCARLLGQWALKWGATEVAGIHRSSIHATSLAKAGIFPISQNDTHQIKQFAASADVVFDAVGGNLAELILESMSKESLFVCYGLLSSQPFTIKLSYPRTRWFHINNYLNDINPVQWQLYFEEIWQLLKESKLTQANVYPIKQWKEAITAYRTPGRLIKPLLSIE